MRKKTKIECSIATTFTKTARVNITSCEKPFESSPKKGKYNKEEHERGSDEPKDEMEITSRPLSLPNIGSPSRTTVNELEGKKTQTLVSWLKNYYSYSSKFNWPNRVSVDQVIRKSGNCRALCALIH